MLSKNIDNAILTSFRTLSKQNNVVTNTFKIVHDRFTPFNVPSGSIGPPVLATDVHTKRLRKLFNAKNHQLYEVLESTDEQDPSSFGETKFAYSLYQYDHDGALLQ